MFFGAEKAHSISTAEILKFRRMRIKKLENSSVNRELSALKRAFNLGIENDKIFRKPKIKMLQENNARQGFFEWDDFGRVQAKLPEYLKAPMTFAYFTGWRVCSEILKIRWPQVDLDAGTVRLEVNTTKNKNGRLIYIPTDLKTLLSSIKKPDIGLVFHNSGKPIANYYKAWHKACKDAGITRVPHDFRRTAIRNLVRAGVSEHTAMVMTGHTPARSSIRYDIVSDSDLKAAAEKLMTFSMTVVSNGGGKSTSKRKT